ncbi:hypothetical protein [Streptomyces sp. NBC_01483]|uniref:hypothetical protein n=1 Tax=Streptomyces sp. NBC_01483 TaxID=2903883 RepID=UPI002E337875|nr:hypothetical protein [Streptomyces sp. NBC_01483]
MFTGPKVQHWQRPPRRPLPAARCPHITIHPLDDNSPMPWTEDPHVFVKKHTRVAIDRPIIPGIVALLTDDVRYLLHLRSANKPIYGSLGGSSGNSLQTIWTATRVVQATPPDRVCLRPIKSGGFRQAGGEEARTCWTLGA